MDLKEGDYIEHLFITTTHHFLLFITSRGKIYRQKVHELPLGSRQSKGRHVANLLPLAQGEKIKAVIATKDYTDAKYLVLRHQEGHRQEDPLPGLRHHAQGRRHHRHQPRRRRRAGGGAAHQRARRPHPGVERGQGHPLPRVRRAAHRAQHHGRAGHAHARAGTCSWAWRWPRTTPTSSASPAAATASARPISSYPTQKRGGQGVITIKDSPDRGDLVGVTSVRNNHELMLISQDGTVIRVPVESVRTTGRNTMGVRVMNLRGADKVSSMARLVAARQRQRGRRTRTRRRSGRRRRRRSRASRSGRAPEADDDLDAATTSTIDETSATSSTTWTSRQELD